MDKNEQIYYFSYGHNTNVKEMLRRIPDAKLIGKAKLYGYKFNLDHFSNILPDKKSNVVGVLWSISHKDLSALNLDEDYKKHYRHKTIKVNYAGKQITALTFIMEDTYRSAKLPTRKYIDYIANGYRQNKISLKQLIDALESRLNELI